MKLLLKTVAIFAAAGLLLLFVLSYLEGEYGWQSNASGVLHKLGGALKQGVDAADDFLESSGIRAAAVRLYHKAAGWVGLEEEATSAFAPDAKNTPEPNSQGGEDGPPMQPGV